MAVTPSLPSGPTLPPPRSRLVIRARPDAMLQRSWVGRALHRLARSATARRQRQEGQACQVKVLSLRGVPICQAVAGLKDVVLELPPGTYDVVARKGERERRYTLTLADQQEVDLFIRWP